MTNAKFKVTPGYIKYVSNTIFIPMGAGLSALVCFHSDTRVIPVVFTRAPISIGISIVNSTLLIVLFEASMLDMEILEIVPLLSSRSTRRSYSWPS